MKRLFRRVYPGLYEDVSMFSPKRCIITRTPTSRPILSELDGGLFIATGGNGYGAMASDAIGRRAAAMVRGDSSLG